jgi:hypothetical protein
MHVLFWLGRMLPPQLDLTRRLRRALRESAHLAGDDREAAALLAGTCRFDRGITVLPALVREPRSRLAMST